MSEVSEIKTREETDIILDEIVSQAHHCMECGKCTGSCPMVELFPDDFHPHHLLSDLRRDPEQVLKEPALWFCASCYKCNARCPQALEYPYFIMQLRRMAVKKNGMVPLRKAFKRIRKEIPFPVSFMSVCIHPERINLDPSVMGNLHRENISRKKSEKLALSGPKIAVVGSGAAGLTGAYELRRKGYRVTIFESHSIPGGMFSMAIPEYRLPLKIVLEEIRQIQDSGIEIRTNTKFGRDITLGQLLRDNYRAILLAGGAHACKELGIKGEDFQGVFSTLQFLEALKIKNIKVSGQRVVVIGGGNTAMDAAAAAMRYGAKEVLLLYRRTREEMPADMNEIREAEKEGVQIRFLEAPVGIHGVKSKLNQLECMKMQLGEPDMTGRRRPFPVEGSNFILETDILVIAIGEKPQVESFPLEIATSKESTILVNPMSMETSIPGVFASGDIVLGPATVPDAIIGARRASAGIDNYIKTS
jgi:NADPH-dependent glutamate synthase beta subunit-like oxidoreductase